MTSPEARARAEIDKLLIAAGWHVCDYKSVDINYGDRRTDARLMASWSKFEGDDWVHGA